MLCHRKAAHRALAKAQFQTRPLLHIEEGLTGRPLAVTRHGRGSSATVRRLMRRENFSHLLQTHETISFRSNRRAARGRCPYRLFSEYCASLRALPGLNMAALEEAILDGLLSLGIAAGTGGTVLDLEGAEATSWILSPSA